MAYIGQITAKEHYLLRMMLCIVPSYQTGEPVSLSFIASEEQISVKYLEQLIRPFMRAGWIASTRGRDGGYVLKKDPKTITLKDLLWLNEKHPHVVECLSIAYSGGCSVDKKCRSKHAWFQVQKAIENALDEITLAQL